jgi:type IV pilus assembly protein PilO
LTLRVSRQQIILFLLACTIILGLLYVGYLYVLKPLKQKEETLSSQLVTEQQLLQQIRNEEAKKREGLGLSAVELQKKLPTKPLVDQFILDLEQAEVVSDSFISKISFENEEGVNNSEEIEMSEGKKEENATSDPSLPKGIEKNSVNLEVTSPSYYQLERFIETLEKLPRIVKVESISFTGSPEVTSANQSIEPLNYTLTVSIYYYPKLEELQKKIPELEIPEPKMKTSPLFEISDQFKKQIDNK